MSDWKRIRPSPIPPGSDDGYTPLQLIILVILFGVLFTSMCGCVSTSEPVPPPIPVPEDQSKPQEPFDTGKCDALPEADRTFCDEVDACHAEYRLCKAKARPQDDCFPTQEKCVITAYRKWKKATGKE